VAVWARQEDKEPLCVVLEDHPDDRLSTIGLLKEILAVSALNCTDNKVTAGLRSQKKPRVTEVYSDGQRVPMLLKPIADWMKPSPETGADQDPKSVAAVLLPCASLHHAGRVRGHDGPAARGASKPNIAAALKTGECAGVLDTKSSTRVCAPAQWCACSLEEGQGNCVCRPQRPVCLIRTSSSTPRTSSSSRTERRTSRR
jgi:hypothetical protein